VSEPVIDDPLWKRQEAANRLRCSLATLDREIAAGRLTAKRIGKQRLVIPESEIRRYLDAC